MIEEQDRTTTTETTEPVVTREPVGTTQQTTSVAHAGASTILYKVIWLVAGIIIALLALRILFLLLGANQGAPFVDFIYGLSGIFAWPFYGVFSYTPAYGHSVFEVSSIVAILIYALIAWGLGKLVTVASPRADL